MKLFKNNFCLLIILCLLSGCATIPHLSVPEDLSNNTIVPGYSDDIRFWADDVPDIGSLISERLEAYRTANADYYKIHNSYPDLNYLAVSGGGNNGAFGAGLLAGWSQSGRRPEFELVTGISTGALMAPFVFLGPQYDYELRKLYTTTNSKGVYKTGFLYILKGLAGGLALTNNAPLAKGIDDSYTPEIMEKIAAEYRKGRRLYIVTTNMEAQRGVVWDIGAIANSGNPDALKLIHEILLASASIPGLFKPVFIDVTVGGKHYREIHADGGVSSQVFIFPLKLKRIGLELFFQYHLQRHLYIVCNNKINSEYKVFRPSFFTLSQRTIESLIKMQALGDLYRLYVGAERDKIDYNLAYIPASFTMKSKELFDPVYMSQLFDVGYALGKKQDSWMKKPPGVDYAPDDKQDPSNSSQ